MKTRNSVISLSLLRTYVPFSLGTGIGASFFFAALCMFMLSIKVPGVVMAALLILFSPVLLYFPISMYKETACELDSIMAPLSPIPLGIMMLRLTVLIMVLTIAFPSIIVFYYLARLLIGNENNRRGAKRDFDRFMGQPLRHFAH